MPRRTTRSSARKRTEQAASTPAEPSAASAAAEPVASAEFSSPSFAPVTPKEASPPQHSEIVSDTDVPAPLDEPVAPDVPLKPEPLEPEGGPYGGPRDWVEPDDIDGSRGFASISQSEITMVLLCLITGLAIVTIAIWYQRVREMGFF